VARAQVSIAGIVLIIAIPDCGAFTLARGENTQRKRPRCRGRAPESSGFATRGDRL
jgi:hypothetical protein